MSALDEEADELVPFTATPNATGVDAAVTAARRVIDALILVGDHTAADLTRVAAQLNAVADQLEEHTPSAAERILTMWSGGYSRHSPATGTENALAPPLQLMVRPDRSIVGVTTLGLPYQGPPSHVHGGVAALLLDDALGVANAAAGAPGMTAHLSLRYRRPTPLFEPLTVSAHQESVDGRKIRTKGSIATADGTVCVQAEGLFIAMPHPRDIVLGNV
jgi:acyl-coenzyme A thioesterase PaaI-like protein